MEYGLRGIVVLRLYLVHDYQLFLDRQGIYLDGEIVPENVGGYDVGQNIFQH